MIHSMTAFARESIDTDQGMLTIELRSVNHRYLDCNFRLPDSLRSAEARFRELAKGSLARGKLDCLLRLQDQEEQAGSLEVDRERLARLLAAIDEVADQAGASTPLNPLEILKFPGVCLQRHPSEEQLLRDAETVFGQALDSLRANRRREGKKLAALVHERLQGVEKIVSETRASLPRLRQQQHDRIRDRLAELDLEADPGRLEQELVLLAQKADVDEELDRLETHVEEIRNTLDKGGPCGRRLDFLMQELNREANTLSSKSIATSTTQNSVELKVLIEQMREQIQNIE